MTTEFTTEFIKKTREIAGTIAVAVDKDEQGEGCDVAAGLLGLEMSEVVRDLARQQLDSEKFKQLLQEFDTYSQHNTAYMGSPFQKKVTDALAD